ncbi:MAG: hypothetical protein J0H42_07495 [Rhizobiales bacterium]|nr:hypothetical protein [Hyphomicrobiales bacterium]
MRFIDVPCRQIDDVSCAAWSRFPAWNGQDDADVVVTDSHQKSDRLGVAPAWRGQDFPEGIGPERFRFLRKAALQDGEGLGRIAIIDRA